LLGGFIRSCRGWLLLAGCLSSLPVGATVWQLCQEAFIRSVSFFSWKIRGRLAIARFVLLRGRLYRAFSLPFKIVSSRLGSLYKH